MVRLRHQIGSKKKRQTDRIVGVLFDPELIRDL